jgi:hypothetical protein
MLRYLRRTRGEVFEVLDLTGDLPGLQAGLAQPALLHQVVDLGLEYANLATHFSQLIVDGSVALNFCQDAPVVQPGDLFPECVVLRG